MDAPSTVVDSAFGLVENKYSEEAQSTGYAEKHEGHDDMHKRVKRERPMTNTCSLFIQVRVCGCGHIHTSISFKLISVNMI